ncbi:hypothetical protein [Corynebacterium nasicanis]|uniref:Uncharacterized protein n=1 Tax=Corynebacterium nasicanis TaxID=1448267 RepID=A0ABW1QBZ2_9CORY
MGMYSMSQPLELGDVYLTAEGDYFSLLETLVLGTKRRMTTRWISLSADEQDNLELMRQADCLDLMIGAPVFSRRLVESAPTDLLAELELYDAAIDLVEGYFHVAGVKKYLPLINEEKSSYRLLSDGSRTISRKVFSPWDGEPFYLARDINYPETLVAGHPMVEFCRKNNFRVLFTPVNLQR